MPHNYCYHSKKSKLIYFEFSSHCLVWLASRLEPAREPPPSRLASLHRAEPSLIFWLAKIASRAELGSARLVSSPTSCHTFLAKLVARSSTPPHRLNRKKPGTARSTTTAPPACTSQPPTPPPRQRRASITVEKHQPPHLRSTRAPTPASHGHDRPRPANGRHD